MLHEAAPSQQGDLLQSANALHNYLAAIDWRGPSPDENVLIHRANRDEQLTPGERTIISIVRGSHQAIDNPTATLLDFLKKEELLKALEDQIQDPYERMTQASDPLQQLRDAHPEIYKASNMARRNVCVHGLPALEGINLQLLIK